MPVFKLRYKFAGNNNTWEEVYYRDSNNIGTAFDPDNAEFVNARLKMLSPLATWVKVIASDVTNPRITKVFAVNKAGTNGVSATDTPQGYNTAAIITLQLEAGAAKRRIWMRAITTRDVYLNPTNGATVILPTFRTKVNTWIEELRTYNYTIRYEQKVSPGGIKYNRILSATPIGQGGQCTLTCADNVAVANDAYIKISQCSKKDAPALGGVFQVSAVAGKTCVVNYQTPNNETVNLTKGRFKPLVYPAPGRIDVALSGNIELGSRKTKNAVSGSRGSRSAARLRTQL